MMDIFYAVALVIYTRPLDKRITIVYHQDYESLF